MDTNILAVVSSWGEGFLKQICRSDSPPAEIVFISPQKALEQKDFFNRAQEFDAVIVSFSFESDLVEMERRAAERFLVNGATAIFLVSPLASFGAHFDGWSVGDENSLECLTRGVATIVTNPADRMVLQKILPNRSGRDVPPHRNIVCLISDPRWNRFFTSNDRGRGPKERAKPLVFLGRKEWQFCSSLESCLVTGIDRGPDSVDSENVFAVDLVISSFTNDLIIAACRRIPAVTVKADSACLSSRLDFLWPAKCLCFSKLADFIRDPKAWAEIVSQQRILFPLPELEVSSFGKVLERILPKKVSLDSVDAFASSPTQSAP